MHQASEQLVRVVVADDSDIAAACLERILEGDARIRVVGRAHNGAELMELPVGRMAHVLLLDALMPEMAGLSALRHLVPQLPVIVVSSESAGSAVAREALAQGALAFFSKADLASQAAMAELRMAVLRGGHAHKSPRRESVVLVAGSMGAIGPLGRLLGDLRDIRIPVLVVQHLPEGKEQALTHTLSLSGIKARAAQHGDRLEPGVLVAPHGQHMRLDPCERIELISAPPIHGHRPSADMLLASALPLGKRAVAIMLSGLGSDGAQAMAALANQGALCLAQHPEDCCAPSMPMAALTASSRVRGVSTAQLGRKVRRYLGHGR